MRPIREARDRPVTPPSLPREDTPPPIPLTEEQAQKLYETEEHTLRELRIFLRDMCKKLANNKLYVSQYRYLVAIVIGYFFV